jgi:DEAD/DEAH box helicase domain-containing protein
MFRKKPSPEAAAPAGTDSIVRHVERLTRSSRTGQSVTRVHRIPARPAQWGEFPSWVQPWLRTALRTRGVEQPYAHQADAWDAIGRGQHVVAVTPTASGKTLCYNVPVLSMLRESSGGTALYLYPTKALAQDQCAEINALLASTDIGETAHVYDGDTPSDLRRRIRDTTRVILTNPDMLHRSVLPNHEQWRRVFSSLRYIVIDEMHSYRGVFGSHVANLIRRLRRICAYYGSSPQFVFASATIANPGELAAALLGDPVTVIERNGAPAGERYLVLYNPPILDAELQRRQSPGAAAQYLVMPLLEEGHATIVFARSRQGVEILTRRLKEALEAQRKSAIARRVEGYRAGYLPEERRRIERALRDGSVLCVVSTNALELGIDIGSLDVCIMTGYSGSIASTWQQAGRAGRRSSVSLVILVASSAPLDQYIINHPEYFFEQSPENATVDPNNLIIVASHLKCAAFEIPFEDGEGFGLDPVSTGELLGYLEEQRIVRHKKNKWYWSEDTYPAEDISLRTAAPGNVVILDTTQNGRVIGEVDLFAAPVEVYENAIYLHQSVQYTIDRLDLEDRKAYARPVEVDYYTDAEIKVDIKVINTFQDRPCGVATSNSGEVSVTWLPTIFKKIKFGTHENVGWGEIHLPETTMHTAAFWVEFPEEVAEALKLSQSQLSEALQGLANTLRQVAPVRVLCDPSDIRAAGVVRAPFTQKPTVFLYETYPGGVGFSDKLFTQYEGLMMSAVSLVSGCGCREGCPGCVGPVLEVGPNGKNGALLLARAALDQA